MKKKNQTRKCLSVTTAQPLVLYSTPNLSSQARMLSETGWSSTDWIFRTSWSRRPCVSAFITAVQMPILLN